MVKQDREIRFKAESRMKINNWLLGACITFFIFSININPGLLRDNLFLSLQITLAIPLFITSIFARAKVVYAKNPLKWNRYGFITFIFGYSFLINVIGILLSNVVAIWVGLVFFAANIISDLVYSFMDLSERPDWKKFIYKDIYFIGIIIIGGILPSLGVF